jgi:hypothetical protein
VVVVWNALAKRIVSAIGVEENGVEHLVAGAIIKMMLESLRV